MRHPHQLAIELMRSVLYPGVSCPDLIIFLDRKSIIWIMNWTISSAERGTCAITFISWSTNLVVGSIVLLEDGVHLTPEDIWIKSIFELCMDTKLTATFPLDKQLCTDSAIGMNVILTHLDPSMLILVFINLVIGFFLQV